MEKAVAEIPVYIPVRNMPVSVGAADNKYPAWRLEYLSSSSFSKEQSEHSDYIIEIYSSRRQIICFRITVSTVNDSSNSTSSTEND